MIEFQAYKPLDRHNGNIRLFTRWKHAGSKTGAGVNTIILVSLAITLCLFLGQTTYSQTEIHREIGETIDNLKSGLWIGYYKNGQQAYKGFFINGEKYGDWITWYDNGEMKEKATYLADCINGALSSYYRNGQLKETYHLFEGFSQGFVISYFENGQIKEKGFVRDGIKAYKWKRWLENGQLFFQGEFTSDPPGQMIGNWVTWYENGVKKPSAIILRKYRINME